FRAHFVYICKQLFSKAVKLSPIFICKQTRHSILCSRPSSNRRPSVVLLLLCPPVPPFVRGNIQLD
uniref:Uncharacterized protein n=1 Tax=Romanomermis culicivorax TaxID=13658 RepID=A0A915KVK4_ROMCU